MDKPEEPKITQVFTDGGNIQVNPSPVGGSWAYVFVGDQGDEITRCSGIILPIDIGLPAVSNNVAELFAVIAALEALPRFWCGEILSDSQITLGRLFQEWPLNGVPAFLQRRLRAACAALFWQQCRGTLLDGHPTRAHLASGLGKRNRPVSVFNQLCDTLCQQEAKRFLEEEWRTHGK